MAAFTQISFILYHTFFSKRLYKIDFDNLQHPHTHFIKSSILLKTFLKNYFSFWKNNFRLLAQTSLTIFSLSLFILATVSLLNTSAFKY